MRKIVLILVLSVFVLSANSQENNASKILAKYGFTTENVLTSLDASKASYSFKANSLTTTVQTTNNNTTKIDKVYTYDSQKKDGEKFTLLSINGKEPTKKDFKHFNKEKNIIVTEKGLSLKEQDFFVESDGEKTAVIGFNMPKEELSSKVAFMAHSTGYIYIDKITERITKIHIKSNESFNMKIFHVTSMKIDINFKFNEEHKQYFIESENSTMQVLILGSIADFTINETYSDFKFK
jgi:hypothetical protein